MSSSSVEAHSISDENATSEDHTTPSLALKTPTWLQRRQELVNQALENDDLEALRRISSLPGGFGSDAMRREVWPQLLAIKLFFPPAGPFLQSARASDAAKPEVVEDDCEPTKYNLDGKAKPGTDSNAVEPAEHHDEYQVLLDTNRSFVTYPKGLPLQSKRAMQADLQELIISILRKYPTLSYFQGFHDIMSVLYLTYIPIPQPPARSRSSSRARPRRQQLGEPMEDGVADEKRGRSASPKGISDPLRKMSPLERSPAREKGQEEMEERRRDTEEWRTLWECAAVVSVCRVRDAMGSGMEGMMGLLRILKRLLKEADPELARFSAQISPVPTLPFFALSWILCLFSHDIDTLEPVQRMFDFLLARNPVSAIYLAVAILIVKKPQMFKLARELGTEAQQDPSLLHPLFARLPPLFPDNPDTSFPSAEKNSPVVAPNDDQNPYEPIALSEVFTLADKLMLLYPWDGDIIRGTEVMGDGSVVSSYALESALKNGKISWDIDSALKLVDKEVVKPGVGAMDEDEDEEEPSPKPSVRRRPVWRVRRPKHKFGTAIAVGILLLGVGIAVYGSKAGGNNADWRRWWTVVIHGWLKKSSEFERVCQYFLGWKSIVGHVGRSLRDML